MPRDKYLRDALSEFLQTWHKCSLVLNGGIILVVKDQNQSHVYPIPLL